jgi:adenylosuccinate synthase
VKRAIITVGLGFGDEGKGATVDYLCRRHHADLVIRYCGGSQAGHNVQLPDGRRHTFSQFGAGTLAGVHSYLSQQFILNPTALAREEEHLRELGVQRPYQTLTLHPDCLVSTYLHQLLNHLREIARGDHRHGSCGHGIGETRKYWLDHGADAIHVRDLQDESILIEKLELLRQRVLLEIQAFVDQIPSDVLSHHDLLSLGSGAIARPLLAVGQELRLNRELPPCGTAIFEGAQGVLLDEWYGFHPHTTWSTVTPQHAFEAVAQSEAEEVCVLGLVRSYLTRHGAGPFPTHDAALTASLHDEGNPWNPWQGHIRAGWLDLVLLRYAARTCGTIDNLGVSCLDQLPDGHAYYCDRYEEMNDLPVRPAPNLAHQERLTQALLNAVPVRQQANRDELLARLGEIAPIALLAHGPTHAEREETGLRFRRRAPRPMP